MESQPTTDSTATARHVRFGTLPERVKYEDLVEERPATPGDPARYVHHPEGSWTTFSCLAADLGL